MWKISLKDTYFCVPLSKDSRNLIRFQWKRSFYECLCLSFGLGPAPIIKGTNVSAEAFDGLGGNNNLGRSLKDILTGRDSVMYLLRHLDFVINF